MKVFERIWASRADGYDAKQLSDELGVSPLIAQILASRGITEVSEANKFLNATVRDLYDPFLLEGMARSVDRIQRAINLQEQIVIYGDYDVDGITSISILLKYFSHIGYPVQYYIPNRLKEGYGINEEAIARIAEDGADLIITVDCGITSVHEAQAAMDMGLDMIITDHHECPKVLPEAFAVINPKQTSCAYPYDMLAGVGIAFKLVHGLMGDAFFGFVDQIIDIAALGTVADVAPISDENRIITKFGLERLNDTENLGLKALIEVSGVSDKNLNTGHIGFTLAPRINAAGRIGTPHLGVELLTTGDGQRAKALAEELNILNEKRQAIERDILEEAEAYIESHINLDEELVLVVVGRSWHTGIIGIVASRIAEKYYRPTVILNIEEGVAKGSARSVGSFSIFDAMDDSRDLFMKFGGHEQAAGVSMAEGNVAEFRERVNDFAKIRLTERDLIPVLKVDGRIHGRDVSYKLIDELELLEPFGLSNPKPQFVIEDLSVDKVMMIGKEKNHLKMIVHDENRVFDSLCFGCEDKYAFIGHRDKIHMVAGLERNSFRGVETIQLMIRDLRKYAQGTPVYNEVRRVYDLALAEYLDYVVKSEPHEARAIKSLKDMEANGPMKDTLVVIESPSDLYAFICTYHDDLDYKYKIHFNRIEKKSGFDLLVLPTNFDQDASRYETVVTFRTDGPQANLRQIAGEVIPDREALVDLYKMIMKAGSLEDTMTSISQSLGQGAGKACLGALILRDLQLIEFERDGDLAKMKLLPKPKEKIDIFETMLFKSLQGLLDKGIESVFQIKLQ